MAENKGKKTLEFVFDKKIYPPAAVKRAVADYSKAARFRVRNHKSSLRVTITDLPPGGEEELGGEFRNYALYLMKAM